MADVTVDLSVGCEKSTVLRTVMHTACAQVFADSAQAAFSSRANDAALVHRNVRFVPGYVDSMGRTPSDANYNDATAGKFYQATDTDEDCWDLAALAQEAGLGVADPHAEERLSLLPWWVQELVSGRKLSRASVEGPTAVVARL